MPDTWWDGQGMCAMYFYEGPVTGERGGKTDTTMNMVLRPGEALVWRWGQCDPVKYHGALTTMPTYPIGHLQRSVGVSAGLLQGDLAQGGLQRGEHQLRPRRPGRRGGQDGHDRSGPCAALTSSWEAGSRRKARRPSSPFPWTARPGRRRRTTSTSSSPIVGPARYEYQLKCELEGAARLRRLAIINDLQMAPLALPEMAVGENTFTYSDQSAGDRKVRITHQWVERSASQPPSAPPAAGLSARRRRGQRHGHRLPVDGRHGSRRRCDRRLPVRVVQPRRHAVAALDVLLQAHLANRRCDQGEGQRRQAATRSPSRPSTPCRNPAC